MTARIRITLADHFALRTWNAQTAQSAQTMQGGPQTTLTSDAALVDEVFWERRTRKLPYVSQKTEAEKIRAEIASRRLERDPPVVKTIARHLRMSEAKSG
jgi:hypothetical protein